MTVLPDPNRNGFFATLQGKVITALTMIALVMGIVMEGISIWRNIAETHSSTQVAINAEPRQRDETTSAAARAVIDTETAKNVAREAKARADEKEAQACTARIDYAMKTMSLQEIAARQQEIFGCDPSYMTQRQSPPEGEACVSQMQAIIRDVAPKNPDYANSPEVKKWMADCSGKMSLQQRDRAGALATAYGKAVTESAGSDCLKRLEQLYAAGPRDITQLVIFLANPEMKKWKTDCDGKMSEAQISQVKKIMNDALDRTHQSSR